MDKEGAGGNVKGGCGYHPLGAWLDNTGEALAALLRPGNGGSNTAAHHLSVVVAALTQLPDRWRSRAILIRADGAGYSHALIRALSQQYLPVVAVLPEVSRVGFEAALCAGTAGIATWDTSPDMMTAIVEAALSGLAMLPSDFVRFLAEGHRPLETLLSEAEIAWFGSLAAGVSVADIAAAAAYPERSMYRLLRDACRAMGRLALGGEHGSAATGPVIGVGAVSTPHQGDQ